MSEPQLRCARAAVAACLIAQSAAATALAGPTAEHDEELGPEPDDARPSAALPAPLDPSAPRAAEPSAPVTGPSTPRGAVGADTTSDDATHHFVVGAVGSYAARLAADEVTHLGGGGLFFEVSLVAEWLDLEYRIRAMSDGSALAFPMDVLLELPLQLSGTAQAFVGLGPTVVPRFTEGSSVEAGATATAGCNFWLTSGVGVVGAASYLLLFDEELVHELGGSLGAAYRF